MSQRAYARYRGVHVRAVQVAIQTGRISTTEDGQIDSDEADKDWAANTRQSVPPASRRGGGDDDDEPFGANQYNKVRSVYWHYQARLAKLEFEQRQGNLISKDEVKVSTFNLARQHRDAMLNIADRMCAVFAAEIKDILIAAGLPAEQAGAVDTTHIHTIMSQEIRKALNDFSDSRSSCCRTRCRRSARPS